MRMEKTAFHLVYMVTQKPNFFKLCGFVVCVTAFHVCAVYHALYLEELTAAELIRKIACVCSLPLGTINQVYRQGPTGILILLRDQVYVHEHTRYTPPRSHLHRKVVKDNQGFSSFIGTMSPSSGGCLVRTTTPLM